MATVNYIPYQRQSAVSLGKVAGYVSQDEKTPGQAHRQETGQRGALLFPLRCPGIPGYPDRPSQEKPPCGSITTPSPFPQRNPSPAPRPTSWRKTFAEQAWPESQVLVATHVDARHIHSHFLVNAVCYESGKMLRQGPRTLEHLRNLSDQLCMKYHYSVLPRERPKQGKEPSTREYRSMEKGPELEAPPDGGH